MSACQKALDVAARAAQTIHQDNVMTKHALYFNQVQITRMSVKQASPNLVFNERIAAGFWLR